MRTSMLLTSAVALAFAIGLAAQTPGPEPATAADCLKATRDFQTAKMKATPPPITQEIYNGIQREKNVFARGCLAKLPIATLPASDLPALVELYTEAAQPDMADATLEKALALTAGDPAARAQTLVIAVRLTMRQPKSDARNAKAEALVAEIEKLPDSFIRERIDGHSALNSYYRADDIDAGIIKHSTRLIEINAKLTPETRVPPIGNVLIAAYENLAEALAGQEQNAKALEVLRRAPVELAGISGVAERLASTIERYELVGKPAAAIEAPTWLNVPAGTTKMAMAGGVTWLQFTAHWCGPCREAYPAAVRLQKQFGGQGFRVVMATQYYGYFESRRNLAPADELEALKTYFPQHGIVWPVAVADSVRQPPPPAAGASQPMVRKVNVNDANYKVSGIPQIHIIDKKGVVRLIMIGFDEANEAQLAKLIERLVKE